jgi:hypothetical protein
MLDEFCRHTGLPRRSIWDDGGRLDGCNTVRFWGGGLERYRQVTPFVRRLFLRNRAS